MLAAGCRSHRADDAKSGPEVIYARAQKAMKNSSYGEAIKQLEALQSRFPFSEPARQAQLDLIYAYYKSRQTRSRHRRRRHLHPRKSHQSPGRLRLLHEGPGVFRAPVQLAGAQIQRRSVAAPAHQRHASPSKPSSSCIEKFPHSQYVADARQRMVFLRNRLADFELHVALYYMRRGAYVGAINRAKYCVENYDGAPAVKGSMKVLVDAYRKLNMMDLAANAERVYADNYPASVKRHHAQEALVERILLAPIAQRRSDSRW